jgi:hypothetical protein
MPIGKQAGDAPAESTKEQRQLRNRNTEFGASKYTDQARISTDVWACCYPRRGFSDWLGILARLHRVFIAYFRFPQRDVGIVNFCLRRHPDRHPPMGRTSWGGECAIGSDPTPAANYCLAAKILN